jgi:RES domain-containing protein
LSDPRPPRDLDLLDAIDRLPRERFEDEVWRVVRDGRDPLQSSRAKGRWSDGTFDVLYTALQRDGAISEIFALLSAQPVFPSGIAWRAHRLRVTTSGALRIADMSGLADLGIDVASFRERDYERSQEIAEAAHFLGFDGLLVPSARWRGLNLVVFADRIEEGGALVTESETEPIDWKAWQRSRRA